MNAFHHELKALVELFRATKTPYVIIGGIAVSLYGESRATFDVDVSVSIEREKVSSFLKKAKQCGFYPLPARITSFIKKTGVIPMQFSKGKANGRCDIIISQNPLEAAAIKRGRLRKINSLSVRVVSPEDLVIHKITSDRPKDIDDARGILLRQKKRINIQYIRDWLKIIEKANPTSALGTVFDCLVKDVYGRG